MCDCDICTYNRKPKEEARAFFYGSYKAYRGIYTQLVKLGYKPGCIDDDGIEGVMACIKCEMDGYKAELEYIDAGLKGKEHD